MIHLEDVPNPFDFANPVSDNDLFIGRVSELDEIRYYLDLTKTAKRPINIALLGHRASGKTSFLNIAEMEARQRGLLTVRIDLDEDDARTQMSFFFKLFNAVFTASCKSGAFGGISGKTYDAYLDAVYSFEVPAEKIFLPFLFPLQYARAMGSGNPHAPISDPALKHDLELIRSEIKAPIVLFFDEGNVLSSSLVHLEKLRNLFMNLSGFMLFITGTPDLFPAMDEVFSPIIRQFKKIEVRAFDTESETSLCITKPLESIGISEINEVITRRTIKEIHEATGGKPYEIQLICHLMFRRLQEKKANMMALDYSVLEALRNELESSQDISARPIVNYIKATTLKQISALSVLCRIDCSASFRQLWAIDYLMANHRSWEELTLRDQYEQLLSSGVLKERNGIVCFGGDQFDKLYAKYFARERGRLVLFANSSPSDVLNMALLSAASNNEFDESIRSIGISEGEGWDGFRQTYSALTDYGSAKDGFVESPRRAREVYFTLIRYRDETEIPIAKLTIEVGDIKTICAMYSEIPDDGELVRSISGRLAPFKERVETIGGEFDFTVETLPVPDIEIVIKKLMNSANQSLRNEIAEQHGSGEAYKAYAEKKSFTEATFHAKCAARLLKTPSGVVANNLGYLLLAAGDQHGALELLRVAAATSKEAFRVSLAHYNCAVALCQLGEVSEAGTHIRECLTELSAAKRQVPPGISDCCIFTVSSGAGSIGFSERTDIPLEEAALNLQTAILQRSASGAS